MNHEGRDCYATVGGLHLHYLEWGSPSGEPVVLLHGLGLLVTAHVWDRVAAALADRFRVIALAQRGFGRSDRAVAYSFELMADDVDGFVRELKLDRFSLIGHSMGGTVALLFAALHRPRGLARLVVEDTVPPDAPSQRWPAPEPRDGFATFDDLFAFVRRALPEPADAELRARLEPATGRLENGRWDFRVDPAVAPAIVDQLNNPPASWWDCLGRIGVPTLLLRGADSQAVTPESARTLQAAMPDCTVVEVPGAGHTIHQDNLDGFLAAIDRFLRP
jgi:pimeloyl-ACP methyl ester carboxylesterase